MLANEDTRLFAWLKEFEEETELPERKNIPSLAYDFLLGAEHLHTIVSTLLSYADLTVHYDEQEHNIKYNTDITNRFINVVYERTSDPHRAVIGYGKLMAVTRYFILVFGDSFAKKGSDQINDETLEIMKSQTVEDQETAIKILRLLVRL